MYNRYIPQSDGSYRRSPGQEAPATPPPCPYPPPPPPPGPMGLGRFFRQLLPNGLDIEDLLIILLLLLMSGDSGEDQNFALLTLGLYLFL